MDGLATVFAGALAAVAAVAAGAFLAAVVLAAGAFFAAVVLELAFLAGAADGAAGLPPVLVARVTASLTDFTVERTADPTREVVERAGALSAVDAVVFRAGAFLAAPPRAVVVPDAAFSATIGPSPFVAHAVDVDKWGRQ
ncbi:MAG TPA: hypothetical protein VFL38_09190 [Humibacillus xanthopallidus]|nr:hypothetical protein [Humibacillus xanthopallidus]